MDFLEQFDSCVLLKMSPPFLQAIFELSRGEHDLIEDLQLARKVCAFKKTL